MPKSLLHLSSAAKEDFGRRPIVADHTLEQLGLFTDAALIELLDRFPRQNLHALTMGTDPTRKDQNRLACHEGVSGEALLRAVKQGCLWLNLTRVDRADARFRALIDWLYAELASQMPGFAPDSSHGNLLISSPQALVYYHVDGPASVLWHLRGRKRVWVYPALDTRFVEREALEDIFAGARHEYLPFDAAFDAAAVVHDLEPGQWMAWSQNAPHRVSNLDGLNVSLTTEHFTAQGRRRARVYAANRFFRTRLGLADLPTRETGAGAMLKTVAHLIARKTGLDRTRTKRHEAATLRVDPDAPGGVVALDRVAGNPAAGA
jgi:hypothetical protein